MSASRQTWRRGAGEPVPTLFGTGSLGLHTPASVHFGTAEQVRAHRAVVLEAAYTRNPERFGTRPTPPKLPTVAWINRPTQQAQIQTV